jgi:hypothetical protein
MLTFSTERTIQGVFAICVTTLGHLASIPLAQIVKVAFT